MGVGVAANGSEEGAMNLLNTNYIPGTVLGLGI